MILEISLAVLAVLTLAVVELKDLIHAIIVMAAADAVLAVIFYLLAAPDIAITQAAVGSGLTAVMFMIAISRTKRSENEE
jgi:uncharacterized MnhB-related membrane protein